MVNQKVYNSEEEKPFLSKSSKRSWTAIGKRRDSFGNEKKDLAVNFRQVFLMEIKKEPENTIRFVVIAYVQTR
ncbi:MAG: hypothetical protein K0R57_654 [Paenibacillaceae bacterium]|nr:hypothetical protein [Paenibacillaceae bacterium]